MPDKPKRRVLQVITALLALTFVITGISKVAAVPPSPENFARWGFSPTFMIGIGVVEILGGIGMMVKKITPFAAILLFATMLGALETGVVHHEALHIVLPLILLGLLGAVIYESRHADNRAAPLAVPDP